MNRFLSTALLAASTFLIGACAEMRWTKSGADAAAVAHDFDDCRAAALGRTSPRGTSSASQDPQIIGRGASPASRSAGASNDRLISEHEEIRVCMLRRGYELQPAS